MHIHKHSKVQWFKEDVTHSYVPFYFKFLVGVTIANDHKIFLLSESFSFLWSTFHTKTILTNTKSELSECNEYQTAFQFAFWWFNVIFFFSSSFFLKTNASIVVYTKKLKMQNVRNAKVIKDFTLASLLSELKKEMVHL